MPLTEQAGITRHFGQATCYPNSRATQALLCLNTPRKLDRKREIRALTQNNQRLVSHLQLVAVPAPVRQGWQRRRAEHGGAAAPAPHRAHGPGARGAAAPASLRSARRDRLYPDWLQQFQNKLRRVFLRRNINKT